MNETNIDIAVYKCATIIIVICFLLLASLGVLLDLVGYIHKLCVLCASECVCACTVGA